jgi:hypothetical protein
MRGAGPAASTVRTSLSSRVGISARIRSSSCGSIDKLRSARVDRARHPRSGRDARAAGNQRDRKQCDPHGVVTGWLGAQRVDTTNELGRDAIDRIRENARVERTRREGRHAPS